MNRNPNAPVRRSAFPPARLTSNQDRIGPTRASETPLRIKTFGLSADEPSRIYVRTRVGFKLGKFALRIPSADVRMRDESGPHGVPTTICTISVPLQGGGLISVERSAHEARTAFDLAIDVTERAVRRWVQRNRQLKRSPRGGVTPEMA